MNTLAKTHNGITPLELNGQNLALEIATRGIVLLKNNGALPLNNKKIALFGAGARHTVKGGSGSGEVNARHTINFYEGLINAGFVITSESHLDNYDKKYEKAKELFIKSNKKKALLLNKKTLAYLMSVEFVHPNYDLIKEEDVGDADTAIYVLSRKAGEGHDESVTNGSYLLTKEEKNNIKFCSSHYKKFVLIINSPFPLDLSIEDECKISAILYTGLLGMEGGTALSNILLGKSNPEGKLAVSYAKNYIDYPTSSNFATSPKVFYKEGVLIGYKHFISNNKEVRYPFGYGLSYTDFDIKYLSSNYSENIITTNVRVKNINKYKGRETVQLYAYKTNQRGFIESTRLVAFCKTKLLDVSEEETISLKFDLSCLSVFIKETKQTVIENGDYIIKIGNSVSNVKSYFKINVAKEIILKKHDASFDSDNIFSEPNFKNENNELPTLKIDKYFSNEEKYEEPDIIRFNNLKDRDYLCFLSGSGLFGEKNCFKVPGSVGHTSSKYLSLGIQNIEMCDGPAGLRLQRRSTITKKGKIKPLDTSISLYDYLPNFFRKIILGNPNKEKILYQFVTGFPSASVLAQTWDTSLARKTGNQVGKEMEEYGVDIWLAPAMNIVRDPLCGRNYEYYSEDPILTGLFASEVCLGVEETPNRYVTIKHFACNNQETERYFSSSEIDEKTLREVYLKPFEIVVKKANPKAVMMAYNKINGVYCANNKILIEDVLRKEWNFKGIVMTDWLSTGKGQAGECKAINAGVDIIMPGGRSTSKALIKGYKQNRIDKHMMEKAFSRMIALAKGVKHE